MNFAEMSEKDILDIANPMMDNLMAASTEVNHEKHVVDFTDRMKNIVTKEYLEKVCERYQSDQGHFSTRELVAVFRRPESAVILWKQYFTKAQGEFVAEMVLVKIGDQYKCDHVMIF